MVNSPILDSLEDNTLSILTDLIQKKITFSQAEQEIVSWATHLTASDPTAAAAVGALVSDAKQAASDAITIGDTALGAIIAPASLAVETAVESALSAATHGVSNIFNPLISAGIDTIANALKAQIDASAMKAKAQLAATPSGQ